MTVQDPTAKNSHTNTGQAPTTNQADISQQSLCLMGSIVHPAATSDLNTTTNNNNNPKDTSITKLEISNQTINENN